jgi:hypothetical protein
MAASVLIPMEECLKDEACREVRFPTRSRVCVYLAAAGVSEASGTSNA